MTLMDSLNNLMYMTQQSYEAVTIRWDEIEWVKLLVGTYGSQYMHVPSALLPYIFHIFGGGTRREPYPTTSLEALILLVVTFFSFLVSLFYFIKWTGSNAFSPDHNYGPIPTIGEAILW